ncbi:hypothetical protein [Candidatus Regiella insecticola]|uniref:hypothetical protein n=1 Tax=Candidatus Regiella insecticola TaxID=138073 RepID=UPI00159702CF|nr:hypothetical protein [Candidatus Regiella insecticola]
MKIVEKVTGISSRALLEELFIMDIMATPIEEGDGCTSQWIYRSVFPSSLHLAAEGNFKDKRDIPDKLKKGMAHY